MAAPPRSPPTFALHSRLAIGGERCTVRFVGLLPNTTPADAPWLGVEWDDRDRGKHDGTHDGIRYFECPGPKAGSFVRPTSNKIQRPQPFLRVLLERYAGVPSPTSRSAALPVSTSSSSASSPPPDGQAETLPSSAPHREEHVSLGSTAIQVAAPNLAKVRRRLGNVPALREVGADDALVGFLGEGEHDEMHAMGPWKTKHLNLSKSLLASWEDVECIIAPLDLLEGLDLTSNRFSLPPPPPSQLPSLGRLTELNLTATFLSFTAILDLEPALPNLRSLTYSSNGLRSFELIAPGNRQAEPASRERRERWFARLQELHLDWNELDDWSRLGFLGELTGLRNLSLSNNRLPSLPLPDPAAHSPLTFLPPKLETLRLAKNAVADWSTVDLLNERLGALRVLWLGGNPLTSVGAAPERAGDAADDDEEDRRERRRVRHVRAGVIARVRGLAVLDGSEISAGERKAAELDYVLSQPDAFCAASADSATRPLVGKARWDELAARHGSAQESDQEGAAREVRKPSAAVLKDKLLNVSFDLPAPSDPSAVTLRFLPSTPLRTVLLKVSKHLDPSLSPAALLRNDGIQLLKGPDGDEGEALEGAKRTLHELGVEEGEALRVLIA